MTKSKLFTTFDGKISKSAIKHIDDEWQIEGKYCRVSLLDGAWDLWLCSPDDIQKGLSTRRINNILTQLEKHPVKATFTKLTGEAYCNATPMVLILDNLDLLGIRKARVYTPEQKAKMTENFNGAIDTSCHREGLA